MDETIDGGQRHGGGREDLALGVLGLEDVEHRPHHITMCCQEIRAHEERNRVLGA